MKRILHNSLLLLSSFSIGMSALIPTVTALAEDSTRMEQVSSKQFPETNANIETTSAPIFSQEAQLENSASEVLSSTISENEVSEESTSIYGQNDVDSSNSSNERSSLENSKVVQEISTTHQSMSRSRFYSVGNQSGIKDISNKDEVETAIKQLLENTTSEEISELKNAKSPSELAEKLTSLSSKQARDYRQIEYLEKLYLGMTQEEQELLLSSLDSDNPKDFQETLSAIIEANRYKVEYASLVQKILSVSSPEDKLRLQNASTVDEWLNIMLELATKHDEKILKQNEANTSFKAIIPLLAYPAWQLATLAIGGTGILAGSAVLSKNRSWTIPLPKIEFPSIKKLIIGTAATLALNAAIESRNIGAVRTRTVGATVTNHSLNNFRGKILSRAAIGAATGVSAINAATLTFPERLPRVRFNGEGLKNVNINELLQSAQKYGGPFLPIVRNIIEAKNSADYSNSKRAQEQAKQQKYYNEAAKNGYIVQKLDTVSSIANKLGVLKEQIVNWNHLTSTNLQEGARLKIGPNSIPQEVTNSLVRLKHTVQNGESVYGISKKYNISMESLIKLNDIKNNLIHPGQELLITEAAKEASSNAGTYIVEKGDYLYKIAQKFNTTVDNLKKWNGLKSNWLRSGQELVTSSAGAASASLSGYTITQGDTLWGIAQRFETTVDNLMKWNGLKDYLILPNQKLVVNGLVAAGVVTVSDQVIKYTVQKNDTLWKISQIYKVPISRLNFLNNLNSSLILVGQTLTIGNITTVTSKPIIDSFPLLKQKPIITGQPKVNEGKTTINGPIAPDLATGKGVTTQPGLPQFNGNIERFPGMISGLAGTVLASKKLDQMTNREIASLPSLEAIRQALPAGWTLSNHNGFVHVKDPQNNYRLRIDQRDRYTEYPHIHFLDPSLPIDFQRDINGNIVPDSSPEAHTPWGGVFN